MEGITNKLGEAIGSIGVCDVFGIPANMCLSICRWLYGERAVLLDEPHRISRVRVAAECVVVVYADRYRNIELLLVSIFGDGTPGVSESDLSNLLHQFQDVWFTNMVLG